MTPEQRKHFKFVRDEMHGEGESMTRREVGVTAPYRKVEKPTWKDAAMRLGEDLASVGPDGYYDMTPKQWLDWALKQVKGKKK